MGILAYCLYITWEEMIPKPKSLISVGKTILDQENLEDGRGKIYSQVLRTTCS